MKPPISRKLPPHNMIVIHQIGLDLFSLSYVKYIDHDIVQYIKHNLSSEDIAQFLGNN